MRNKVCDFRKLNTLKLAWILKSNIFAGSKHLKVLQMTA